MHGYDPCDAIDERPLLQEASDDTRAAREPDYISSRRVTAGETNDDEREGSRAAHHLAYTPEAHSKEAFEFPSIFSINEAKDLVAEIYRERERTLDLLYSMIA
jgi:hypothetical protein